MNERIKELAEEATTKVAYYPDRSNGHPEYRYDFDQEKFAELIVLECVRYFNEDYERDFDTLWREDLTKNIKEHFGVKE